MRFSSHAGCHNQSQVEIRPSAHYPRRLAQISTNRAARSRTATRAGLLSGISAIGVPARSASSTAGSSGIRAISGRSLSITASPWSRLTTRNIFSGSRPSDSARSRMRPAVRIPRAPGS